MAYEQAEKNLELLGATGVEDRLQDCVTETLDDLRTAGIKLWICTGDKLETAMNVARSCNLLDAETMDHHNLLILARCKDASECGQMLTSFSTNNNSPATHSKRRALMVDGKSLHYALNSHKKLFLETALSCTVVICCRMLPIQKAEVVKLVKESKGSPVTAAIGDGANDVSMIQEAHVGLGLTGKEGRQAVNSSDFSFTKFRFIRRILLVHGNLYYNRVSNLIHYFFYKVRFIFHRSF